MLRVAAYCRVSTDSTDQANSLESQKTFFEQYISLRPDWELYAIYADEGVTGTSRKKRPEFNRMMNDARMNRFDLVLTKEVSRFSRNLLDTISCTRELKRWGVGVYFMSDGFNSLEPDAELRLSIMGSFAQEESRKTSLRVKWGQERQMEKGVVFGHSLLGYDVSGGQIRINPEGARIVKLIFHKYGVEKKGTSVIARELRESGFRTLTGEGRWSPGYILKILKNEKYVGDLVQKKTYTPDYLTHAKKPNRGMETAISIRAHHEPIIERELWEAVQRRISSRNRHANPGAGHSDRYIFSGKIRCGECGSVFVSRSRRLTDGTLRRYWRCSGAVYKGSARTAQSPSGCSIGRRLRDDIALEMLRRSLRELKIDKARLVEDITRMAMEEITKRENAQPQTRRYEREIELLKKKKERVLDAFFSGNISKEEMRMMSRKYDALTETAVQKLNSVVRESPPRGAAISEEEVRAEAAAIAEGGKAGDIFLRRMIGSIVVFKDGSCELRLNSLEQTWDYLIGPAKKSGGVI